MSEHTPVAEFEIDETLVRNLLNDQHPDLSELDIRPLGNGWDNSMFRLGGALTIRLPRRATSAQLILNEQRCAGPLADRLPLSTPTPVRIGRPALGYPWSWSVLPWIPDEAADLAPPYPDEAKPFAPFLHALHQPAPEDAPINEFRGVPLSCRAADIEERLARLRDRTDRITPSIDALWSDALSVPETTESIWIHGDLHSRNILVDRGRLSSIIDWGDITSGDTATDLAGIWSLFEQPAARREVLRCYAVDESTLRRARGWAILFGTVLLDTGLADNPRHAAMGDDRLRRLASDID